MAESEDEKQKKKKRFCYGGSTQYMPYSADDTFESVKQTEKKSGMNIRLCLVPFNGPVWHASVARALLPWRAPDTPRSGPFLIPERQGALVE